jgi:hypothetical protein
MALQAPKGNQQERKFTPQANLEAGTYPARCVQIIDFGLQPQKPYMGKDKPPAQEIGVTYELLDEFMKDEDGKDIEDKPRWVSETFPFHPLFAENAKSTKRIKALDPNDEWQGDITKMLDVPMNVTIVNNVVGDKIYDNVALTSAMRPKDAEKAAPLVNPSRFFDLDAPDLEMFNKFPKWIQDKIKGNLNYQGSPLQKLLGGAAAAPKKEPVKQEEEEASNNPY